MNTPVSILLRCLGLNRPAPRSRLGRCLRRSERILIVLAVLYAGLHVFPQTLFAHSVTAGGITIYSRASLPPEAASCAVRAAGLIEQSELAVPGRRERVFVCDAPWLFQLFRPGAGGFAYSVPVTDNVFVAAADFASDIAVRQGSGYNKRSFSSVAAHEITHGLIRHRLGLWRGLRLPDWVDEGYCDYVARESSFPEAEGRLLFASGERHPSMSYRYFEYRQMVRFLIEQRHLTFAEVVARSNDPDAVAAEARQAFQDDKP